MRIDINRSHWIPVITCLALIALTTHGSVATAAPKEADDTRVLAPDRSKESAQRAVPAPANCGAMEFNRETGGMVRRSNVDLVVKHLEIFTTDRGTWIRPTISNRCPQGVSGNIHVSIGEVVVTFAGLPGMATHTLGYAVGVAPAASYRVTVDYDNRIAEADERNNSCTRSTTGNCP
jgi:hypothetical protein